MEIFRKIKEKWEASKQEAQARLRTQELDFANEAVLDMYIHGQADLTHLTKSLRRIRKDTTGFTRELGARLSFDLERWGERRSDQMLEEGISGILDFVGADWQKKAEIRARALYGAHDYWTSRLTQQDLTPDEIMLGRRRLTQINAKLEAIHKKEPAK